MNKAKERYNVSFRCFYDDETGRHYTNHYQPDFPMSDIPRWIDAYKFTHPNCVSINVKIWFVNTWDTDED